MSDALWCGMQYRTFNMVDDYNCEALNIEIDMNLPAARVVRTMERIADWRDYPAKIRIHNWPEFISETLADWAQQHVVELESRIHPAWPHDVLGDLTPVEYIELQHQETP